jgi:hypothetical protein
LPSAGRRASRASEECVGAALSRAVVAPRCVGFKHVETAERGGARGFRAAEREPAEAVCVSILGWC